MHIILTNLKIDDHGIELLINKSPHARSTRTAISGIRISPNKTNRGTMFGSFIANSTYESKKNSQDDLNEYADLDIISRKSKLNKNWIKKQKSKIKQKESKWRISSKWSKREGLLNKKRNIKIVLNIY